MKRTLRSIFTFLTLTLMFTILATSVFAATASVTDYAYASWRGNGSTSGRGVDDVTMSIDEGTNVTFETYVEITLDPSTSSENITATAALRQYHWYGYSTVVNLTLFNDYTMSNSSTTAYKVYSITRRGSATTTSDGDYYMVAKTSGASSAFYSYYYFTITH